MTVIDELVTILGLDIAPGVLPKIQKFNSVIDSVTKYVGWASAGLLAAATSITYFAERMNAASTEMQNFSDLTGMKTDDLQELGFAVEQVGGHFSSLQNDLLSLAKSMSSPIPGEYNHALFMLGVSAYDTEGKLKSADQVMMDIAKKFEGMSKIEQMQWGNKIGLSDDTIMLLGQGIDKIKELRQQAQDIPTIVGAEQLKNAKEFVIQLSMVRRVLSYIGQQAAAAAGPALKSIVKDFTEWLRLNREFIQTGLKNIIDGIVDGFKRFGNMLRQIRQWVEENIPGLKDLVGNLTEMNTISGLIFGALAVVAGVLVVLAAKFVLVVAAISAVVLVFEDLMTYFEGGESVIGDLIKYVEDLWSSFSEKMPGIAGLIRDLGQAIAFIGGAVWDAAIQTLKNLGQALEFVVEGLNQIGNVSLESLDWLLTKLGFGPEPQTINIEEANRPLLPSHQVGGQGAINSGNTIEVKQYIQSTDPRGAASEAAMSIGNTLQQTFPGGLTPVTN